MKLGRLNINLARTAAPTLENEAGTAVSHKAVTIMGDVYDLSSVKIHDLIRMRQTDAMITAIYNVMTLPIIANPWDIIASPEDKQGKQAQLVKDNFAKPPHEGGMDTPFSLVLADMLRAIAEGWRAYELVWTISPDGYFVYKKIASRDNQTVILRVDDKGDYNGFMQRAWQGNKFMDVIIQPETSFLFTYGKDKDWLVGESAFKSCYYNFVKKQKLVYLAEQAAQQFAIPPKVASSDGTKKVDQTAMDAITAALSDLGVSSATALPPGWKADVLSATGRIDVKPLLDWHNAEMARAALADFLLLGSGTDTGSWSLSTDKTDMFILSLRGVMSNIEEHINNYLIPQLIDYNFENPYYPRFKFADITDATADAVTTAITDLIRYLPNGMPDYLIKAITDKMANQLGVEVPNKPEEATANTIGSASPKAGGAGVIPPTDNTVTNQSHKHKRATFLAKGRWARPLTPAENKVQFSSITDKLDSFEANYATAIKPIWDSIRDDLSKQTSKILTSGKYKDLNTLTVNARLAQQYKAAIIASMTEAYNYAKTGAADEMGTNSPATPNQTRDLINQQADAVVTKQFSDLIFQVVTICNDAIRKNQLSRERRKSGKVELSIATVVSSIAGAVSAFYSDKTAATASVIMATAINIGRMDAFKSNSKSISKYQYSAIMDNVTCPICEELDGTVVDQAEYDATQWQPPIHFSCRCIWVEILDDEDDQPEITGFPDEPGGVTKPTLDASPDE